VAVISIFRTEASRPRCDLTRGYEDGVRGARTFGRTRQAASTFSPKHYTYAPRDGRRHRFILPDAQSPNRGPVSARARRYAGRRRRRAAAAPQRPETGDGLGSVGVLLSARNCLKPARLEPAHGPLRSVR